MVQEGELALTDSIIFSHEIFQELDTVAQFPEPVYGLVMQAPPHPVSAPLRTSGNLGISFLLSGLFILFLIIALRFRNNYKYVIAIFNSMLETRTRHNVFDDTVRETSLIVLLNIMWCVCVGIIGYFVYAFFNPELVDPSHKIQGILWGMVFALAYVVFMMFAYASVGWIFSDKRHSELWIKGYSASQALTTPAYFVIALIAICHPTSAIGVGVAGITFFVTAKLMFIWKGYRIFFSQFSSWVLFLCYLCSLEIVPLILSYRSAVLLGEVL